MPLVVNPLIAFGFANLAMLGWLAAAAAPILIHLWMRQTHRETTWAAIRFLQAALERQARKLRLQHWLLLAVRTLLLVLLALAAAKPLLDSAVLSSGIPTHRVLLIDASLSMNATDSEGRTALQRAKAIAISLIDRARAGDSHSVVVMGADAGALVGRPTADLSAARRAVEAVAPSLGVADLASGIATSERLVRSALEISTSQRQEIFVISDLAANTWEDLAEDRATPVADAYQQAIESGAKITAIDVGSAVLPNTAVTSVSLASGLPTLAAPVEVLAEARVYGGKAVECVAELLVDGAPVQQQPIKLTPSSTTPIDFTHRFERAGPRSISVRIVESEEAIAEDNRRYLAATLRSRTKILCIAGAPEAANYLADALDPTGQGAYEPVVVSDADLRSIDLDAYACVFLSNLREVSASEAKRLREYVERGGGVAWFLGDRVSPLRYNETLAPPRSQFSRRVGPPVMLVSTAGASTTDKSEHEPQTAGALLPGWLAPSVAAPSYRIDPLDYTHPITRPFEGQERSGLLNIPVMRHLPIKVPPGNQASVAMTLENGDPLLVTGQLGRGRVAVITTAATLDSVDPATGQPWTALPAWPSFLPIVRGLVAYLANDQGQQSYLVGDLVEGYLSSELSNSVAILHPDGTEIAQIAPEESGAWRFESAKAAGVYLYGPAGETAEGAVAVNVDTRESDPATVDRGQLPEELQVLTSAEEFGTGSGETAASTPIHRWLLYGALMLALVEPAMACLFGRGSG